MEYYDIEGKSIIIPDNVFKNYINSGSCGSLYKYDENSCIKIYDQKYSESEYRLKASIYKDTKEINSPNLLQIINLLFEERGKIPYNVDAFIAKLYKEKYPDFLEVPTSYLLENIERIIELSNQLSKKRIRVDDLKRKNIILTDKDIVFVDLDMWYYSYSNTKEISSLNINNISSLFNIIAKEALKHNHQDFILKNNLYSLYCDQIIDRLFPMTDNSQKLIKKLEKKLNGYERPIDYIYSRKK